MNQTRMVEENINRYSKEWQMTEDIRTYTLHTLRHNEDELHNVI